MLILIFCGTLKFSGKKSAGGERNIEVVGCCMV